MQYLFTLQDCFLAKKKWQDVMSNCAGDEATTAVERDRMAMLDQYFVLLAKIPSVLRCGYVIRETRKHGMPIDASQVAFIRQHGTRLREEFLIWYERYVSTIGMPREAPSEDPSSPYETVLLFENNWFGSVTIGYWTCMLIVHACLDQAAEHELYAEGKRQYARNIYRSLENVSKGLMGPYRVGFGMRISYDFADLLTQHWILSMVDQMEKRYASTRSEVYPPPSPNEYSYN